MAVGLVVLGILLLQQLVPAPGGSPAAVRSPAPGPASSSPSPSVPPGPTPTPALTGEAPRLPLTVLNNSRRAGLAKRAAAGFARAGWPVATVGNLRGRFAETTVYYAPGQQDAALRLRREFPAIGRMLPRFAGLPGAGLTVVLTRDYPA